MKRIVLIVLVLLVMVGTAGATTRTVCSSGCDYTTNGTDDHIEIQNAINASTSYDTVFIKNGTYNLNETILINRSNINIIGEDLKNVTLNISRQIIAFNLTSENASTTTTIPDETENVYLENTTLKNFTIDFFDIVDSDSGYGVWAHETRNMILQINVTHANYNIISIKYSRNYSVINSYLHGTAATHSGIYLVRNDLGLINNSRIVNGTTTGIEINQLNKNTTITYNTVGGFTNANLYLYGGSKYIRVEHNDFSYGRKGIYLITTSDSVIKHNSIHDEAWYGIDIQGWADSDNNINMTIENNNIYNNTIHGIYGSYFQTISGNITYNFTNNNIVNNSGNGIFLNQSQTTFISRNNIIINNSNYGLNISQGNITSIYDDVWNNANGNYSGLIYSVNNISVNPLFNDTSIPDFHLKSQYGRWNGTGWTNDTETSSAIGVGDPSSDNSLSPWGGIIEMGAYGNTAEASKVATDNATTDAYYWQVNNGGWNYSVFPNVSLAGIASLQWANISVMATNLTYSTNSTMTNYSIQMPAANATRAPSISSWGNNYTSNASLSFSVPSGTSVQFNITFNQSGAVAWTNLTDAATNGLTAIGNKTFTIVGLTSIDAQVINANGSSNLVVWSINVTAVTANPPAITSYSPATPTIVDVNNLKTFSAGSNQSVTWTWTGATEGAGDGTPNSSASNTWATTGAKTVTATCSNANGSCGTTQWDVTVVSDGSGGGSDYDWLSGSCSPNGATITTNPNVGSTICAVGTYSFGYVFDRTGVGTYTIGMTKVGYTSYSAPLVFNEDHEILDITLTSSVSPTGIYNLSGYISNSSGYAMNNSTVRFSMQSVVTGPSGYYNFSGLSKQVNNVAADAPGHYMNFTQITLTTNKTQNLSLTPKDDSMKTPGPSIILTSGALTFSYLLRRTRKKRITSFPPKRI